MPDERSEELCEAKSQEAEVAFVPRASDADRRSSRCGDGGRRSPKHSDPNNANTTSLRPSSHVAAGFDYDPIADESIGFGTGDPRFHIAPTTDLVTQTVTATFSVNAVAETFFKAVIE